MYDVTYENLMERMLASVDNKFDKREGSVIFDTLSPTAVELQILYTELNRILSEAYGDSASREFLILRCAERGIKPCEATNAILKAVFTPDNIDVTGRRFNIGEMNYTVIEKIADGEYKVQCETAGISGNQYLGAMIPVDYVECLETAELTEVLIPGEDEEDTESLRSRYFASFEEKAFGGNIRDYIEKTNAIAGVGSVKVTPVWNTDISPGNMIPTEAVTVWYNNVINTVNEDVFQWLSGIYAAAAEKKLTTGGTVLLTILDSEYGAASETLIENVQNVIDPSENAGDGYGLAPIGHVVNVKTADEVRINIHTTLVFESGYGWSNLKNSIESAVADYLLELRKLWEESEYLTVRTSQIDTRLLAIKGIVDIEDTKINGLGNNLILGKYEIPVFGGVGV